MNIQKTNYQGWQTYSFTTGHLDVTVLPDLGGRIISLRFHGQELLFTQAQHVGETFDLPAVSDLNAYKTALGFRLWGGDKTWVSPQAAWALGIPPLDLDAGRYQYEPLDNGVRMTSSVCRETGLQIERTIIVTAADSITLTETLWNHNNEAVRHGIWDVTQVLKPARVSFSSTPDKIKAFAEEGESVAVKSHYVTTGDLGVVISCGDPVKFKYGGIPTQGRVVTRFLGERQGVIFERNYGAVAPAEYAHGCAVEVYNSPDYPYFEVEIHAPFTAIPAGGKVSHTQVWSFYRA